MSHVCSDSCPVIANSKPFYKELKAGRSYLWCACGRSKRQPFCDGRSHEGTGFEPVRYTAREDGEEVLFCGCKHTTTPPFCDGTHSNLPGGYSDAEPAAGMENRPLVDADSEGIVHLDGHCRVIRARRGGDSAELTPIVGPYMGAEHLAQYHLSVPADASSAILGTGAADAILWVMTGRGTLEIGATSHTVTPLVGLYVRAGESFRLTAGGEAIDAFISLCPGTAGLQVQADMNPAFDAEWPVRSVPIDEEGRQAMGPRWFQMLVDKRVGSTTAAQFIGHIPQSRAEMHRHLYEEALIIVSGEGVIWNETRAATVAAGDVIFFPRKHWHTLECTAESGMDVVGIIHPGDNPGINY